MAVEVRKLHRRGQRDPSLVYQFQNIGNEVGETDIAEYLNSAVVSAFANFTCGVELRTNLVRS